ncbi:MAG: zonular occludens toxin domain-containing protein [Pseudomonadota bacterium]
MADDAQLCAVYGGRGSGKSAWIKAEIAARKQLVIFDPMADYATGKHGLPSVKETETLIGLQRAIEANWTGFRVQYRPRAGNESASLSAICKYLLSLRESYRQTKKGGFLTLVVDEVHLAFPSLGGVQKCQGFAEVCTIGRHYGIEVFTATQRVTNVHRDFRTNATRRVVFRQQDRADARTASELVDATPQEIGMLPKLNFFEQNNGIERAGVVKFRQGRKTGQISYVR